MGEPVDGEHLASGQGCSSPWGSECGLVVNSALPLQPSFSHLGFCVTDRLGNGDQEILFLSRSLLEHHQIVLAPGRSETSASTIHQVSFETETLRKLIDAFQGFTELGITGMESLNHGGSWLLHVPDPEGNTIELFVRTDWYVPLHAMTGLHLNQPEEAIRQQTALMVQQTPGSKTWEVWRQEFQKRMDPRG